MRHIAPLLVLAAAVFALPSVTRAQSFSTEQVSPAPVVTASIASPAGPSLDDATVGIRHNSAAVATNHADVGAAVRHGEQSTVLMIVGGATLLAGAVIGGDAGTIIMIGGAAIGIYGLYLYLQ